MEFSAIRKLVTEVECDVLILNLFQGVKEPGGATGAVDRALGGAIRAVIARENFEGKIGEVTDLTPCGGVPAARVIVVGLGKQEEFDAEKIRRASSAAARCAKKLSAHRVATVLHGGGAGGIDPKTSARAIVEGTMLGTYQFTRHKTSDVTPNPIERVEIVEMDAEKIQAIDEGIHRSRITAEAVNFARDLTNEPANILTPTYLARQATEVAKEAGIECRVEDRAGIERLGMNLFLAVAKGSREEPRLIILRYKAASPRRTIALIGKGITFDSGGINLKPSESLKNMKDDMAGSGVVLATMRAIAALKPDVNVLALLPATENMIGGDATKVGDVITGLSGKTVEIDNTDAEGRLLVADAAAFAESEGVDEIIDIATLTGACVIALGRGMAGVIGSDQGVVEGLIRAGSDGGETLWQLPLYREYEDNLKSEVADMNNTGGREAGAINGALFIKKHIDVVPWAHIDIAGPATIEKDTPLSTKGATGFGVRTLINYVLGL